MADDEDYQPSEETTESESTNRNNVVPGNWRNAVGEARVAPRFPEFPQLPAVAQLCDAAAVLDGSSAPPVVPFPFDLLRLKRVNMANDLPYLIETQKYMQSFAPSAYTPWTRQLKTRRSTMN